MTNQPNRGKLKDLWDLLDPNQGYYKDQVMKIANDFGLGDSTAYNLLNKQRGYLIYSYNDRLYYRSDSDLKNLEREQISHEDSTKKGNDNVNGEKSISEVIKDIKDKLNLKRSQKEQISLEKREIEEKEKVLEDEILKLEHSLTVLQVHL